MSNILKSWKTSLVGLIALIGLAINVYNNGLSAFDFILLVGGVGFMLTKDANKSHSKSSTVDGDKDEYPDGKG